MGGSKTRREDRNVKPRTNGDSEQLGVASARSEVRTTNRGSADREKRTETIDETSATTAALEPEHLSSERYRIQDQINQYYRAVPELPIDTLQEECLGNLLKAEKLISESSLDRTAIIEARQAMARVEIIFNRVKADRFSWRALLMTMAIAAIAVALIGSIGWYLGWFRGLTDISDYTLLSVPAPVWVWATIGALTSMLVRAGNLPFTSRMEVNRWLLYRPIVGIIMGVLIYLLLQAGLVVFAGQGQTQAPELTWVIVFAGAFSDTLSLGLLQRLIGDISAGDFAQSAKNVPARNSSK